SGFAVKSDGVVFPQLVKRKALLHEPDFRRTDDIDRQQRAQNPECENRDGDDDDECGHDDLSPCSPTFAAAPMAVVSGRPTTPTREGRHGDERWGGTPPVAVSSCPDVASDGTPFSANCTENERVPYGNPIVQ